jgi:hypothetical protein
LRPQYLVAAHEDSLAQHEILDELRIVSRYVEGKKRAGRSSQMEQTEPRILIDGDDLEGNLLRFSGR